MTDDEALAILQSDDCDAWIRWDDEANRPDWWNILGTPTIQIDGELSEEQMLALIHFEKYAK